MDYGGYRIGYEYLGDSKQRNCKGGEQAAGRDISPGINRTPQKKRIEYICKLSPIRGQDRYICTHTIKRA
jgi:hypothetical protein